MLSRIGAGRTAFAAAAFRRAAPRAFPRMQSSGGGDIIGIDLGTTNSCVAIMEVCRCDASRVRLYHVVTSDETVLAALR